MSPVLLVLFLAFQQISSQITTKESRLLEKYACNSFFCGAGKQCLVTNGKPGCACLKSCGSRTRPVCGNDLNTYESHCELHRQACISGVRIFPKYRGSCKVQKKPLMAKNKLPDPILKRPFAPVEYQATPDNKPQPMKSINVPIKAQRRNKTLVIWDDKPLVCTQVDRNELRHLVIELFKSKIQFKQGESYKGIITSGFKECDQNNDEKLNTQEFMECIELNNTIKGNKKGEKEMLMRGLCVDALISMSDQNSDWVLDVKEFSHCLDPSYQPIDKLCSLNGKEYIDGIQIEVKCNTCICACGSWVCTEVTCQEEIEGKTSKIIKRF